MKTTILKLSLFAFVATAFFASCTVAEEYTFNADFSGKHQLAVTFEEVNGRNMGEMMVSKMAEDEEGKKELIEKMDSVEGISNSYVMAEGSTLTMGYQFKDLSLIGAPFASMSNSSAASSVPEGMGNGGILNRFELKGNKLYFYQSGSEGEENAEEAVPAQMEEMMENIKYNVTLRFANKVKAVSNDKYVIAKDKMSVSATYTNEDKNNADDKPIIITF